MNLRAISAHSAQTGIIDILDLTISNGEFLRCLVPRRFYISRDDESVTMILTVLPSRMIRHVRVHHVDRDKDDPLLRDVLAQRPMGPLGRRRSRLPFFGSN